MHDFHSLALNFDILLLTHSASCYPFTGLSSQLSSFLSWVSMDAVLSADCSKRENEGGCSLPDPTDSWQHCE